MFQPVFNIQYMQNFKGKSPGAKSMGNIRPNSSYSYGGRKLKSRGPPHKNIKQVPIDSEGEYLDMLSIDFSRKVQTRQRPMTSQGRTATQFSRNTRGLSANQNKMNNQVLSM